MRVGRTGAWVAVVAVAGSILAPFWLRPSFGLLDDGTTLDLCRRLEGAGSLREFWETMSGRLSERVFPAVWLWCYALWRLSGTNPLGWAIGHGVLLAATLVLVGRLARVAAPDRALAPPLAAFLFVLAPSLVENYGGFGKQDPVVTLFALAWALSFLRMDRSIAEGRRLPLGSAVAFVAALLALHATKETAVANAPALLLWVGQLALVRAPARRNRIRLALAAAAATGLLFVASRAVAPKPLGGGPYTAFYDLDPETAPATIARGLATYGALLAPGALYAAPALLRALGFFARGGSAGAAFTISAFVAWFGIYLPWKLVEARYLLPAFAFASPVLAAALLAPSRGFLDRGLRLATIVLAAVSLPRAATNSFFEARIRNGLDRAGGSLLERLAEEPQGSTAYLCVEKGQEQLGQVNFLLDVLRGRDDLRVRGMFSAGGQLDEPYPNDPPFLRSGGLLVVAVARGEDEVNRLFYPPTPFWYFSRLHDSHDALSDLLLAAVREFYGMTLLPEGEILSERMVWVSWSRGLLGAVLPPLPRRVETGFAFFRIQPANLQRFDPTLFPDRVAPLAQGWWGLRKPEVTIPFLVAPGEEKRARRIPFEVRGEVGDVSLSMTVGPGGHFLVVPEEGFPTAIDLPPNALASGPNGITISLKAGSAAFRGLRIETP